MYRLLQEKRQIEGRSDYRLAAQAGGGLSSDQPSVAGHLARRVAVDGAARLACRAPGPGFDKQLRWVGHALLAAGIPVHPSADAGHSLGILHEAGAHNSWDLVAVARQYSMQAGAPGRRAAAPCFYEHSGGVAEQAEGRSAESS